MASTRTTLARYEGSSPALLYVRARRRPLNLRAPRVSHDRGGRGARISMFDANMGGPAARHVAPGAGSRRSV